MLKGALYYYIPHIIWFHKTQLEKENATSWNITAWQTAQS